MCSVQPLGKTTSRAARSIGNVEVVSQSFMVRVQTHALGGGQPMTAHVGKMERGEYDE